MNVVEAVRIMKAGHNVYLTGAAGSGKTYLLNRFIQYLRDKRINVAVTASTGIAATHLRGVTVHSWAGIGLMRIASDKQIQEILGDERITRRFKETEILIIDEISMLDADRLDLLEKLIRLGRGKREPFGGMQIVLCGDFFQLPPVTKGIEPVSFVYKSSAWNNMDLKVCYLHGQYRQEDKELITILNAIRGASVNDAIVHRLNGLVALSSSQSYLNHAVKLYPLNVNADYENERELATLPGEQHEYQMQRKGVSVIAESLGKYCLAPEKLVLKRGASVMFLRNNVDKGYANGSLGRISGFNKDGFPVVTLLNNKSVVAEPATWTVEENSKIIAQAEQIPLRLAWAITVHKSQGMTLEAAEVDLRQCFESGMGYVALSRVRSLGGLRVLGFNEMALKVNEEILVFDEELKQQSQEVLRESRLRYPKPQVETKKL